MTTEEYIIIAMAISISYYVGMRIGRSGAYDEIDRIIKEHEQAFARSDKNL